MQTTHDITTRLGKRGTVVIPQALRRQAGLQEGDLLVAELREDGILLRVAVAVPVEIYTPERRAEFLLANATDADDLVAAGREVASWGVDSAAILARIGRSS